jgi:uncharacterized protein with NRDE domain
MCLIVFAWQPGGDYPLLLAANRDEFHRRSAAPMAWWEDAPQILAGRDLEAGGTWLGVTANGRLAAVTNVRDPQAERGQAARSRGDLTREFLQGTMPPDAYLQEVSARVGQYQGFNLLVGDCDSLWYLHGSPAAPAEPQELRPAVYGLSNAALDVPWPKVEHAKAKLAAIATAPPSLGALRACVTDRSLASPEALSVQSLEGEMAQRLSAQFIVTPEYGTRCNSALLVRRDGQIQIAEQRFGADGVRAGESAFTFSRRRAG